MSDYDLVVVGAGPVGENVADYAHRGGLSVALVEAELVGGECSYWACIPSKALLRSGSVLAAARRLDGAKQAVGTIDAAAVLRRRSWFTGDGDDAGQATWVASAGLDLIRGHARLVGPGELDVGGRRVTARAIALATGSVPQLPDIPGLAEAAPWSTREATSSPAVPGSLAVIGGGVAAVELAQAYAWLGSKVTLLARSGLLRSFEPFAAEQVADGLREAGVGVRLGVVPDSVSRQADGVHLRLGDTELVADEVLVSTGRVPRTQDVGLESVGLTPDGPLVVDDSGRVVGAQQLWAAGDITGRALLTHQGKYAARIVGAAIAAELSGSPLDTAPWGEHVATADHHAVPQVVFTDPEVAAVGLTERAARAKGLNFRVVDYEIGHVAGASLHADGYRGTARAVVDEDRGVLVGVTFVGQDVAELIHAATVAIVGEVPLTRLWHAVPAYPTISEIWLRLLETYRS